MSKKTGSILLAVLIMISVFAGCAKKNAGQTEQDAAATQSATQQTTDADPTEEDVPEVPAPLNESVTANYISNYEIKAGQIPEKTLVDEKNIRISTCSISAEADQLGVTVLLNVQNDTDRSLYIQTRNETLNGCVMNGLLSEQIPAKSSQDVELTFDYDEVRGYGIRKVGKIELNFYLFDAETYEEYLMTDTVVIDTGKADDWFDFVYDGVTIYEDDALTIKALSSRYYSETNYGDYTAAIYVENRTDAEIYVSGSSVSAVPVEERMEDVSFSAQIPAGCRCIRNAVVDFKEINLDETSGKKVIKMEFAVSGTAATVEIPTIYLTFVCAE